MAWPATHTQPATIDALLTHHRRTRARLLRVQRAIGVYEELACAAAMPPELRPDHPVSDDRAV